MKINEVIVEADPKDLGPMNPQMRDVLSKVHAGDVKQAQADAEAKAKAKADQRAEAARLRKENPEMLQQYIDMLKKHDWTYEYSDGYSREYTKGRDERYAIMNMAKKIDPDLEIYNKYNPLKKENVEEGGFFDPDQPNPGDMVKHRNGAVGKVKKIGTQDDETWVYFKDKNGEMNFGQWKKSVFPVGEEVDEAFTTAVAITKDDFKRYVEGPYKTKIAKIFKDFMDRGIKMSREGDKIVFDGDPKLMRRMERTLKQYDDNPTFATEATAGATVASNFATGPVAAHTGGTSYTGKPGGPSGKKAPKSPKVIQPKEPNGTAKGAHKIKGVSLFGGQGLVKR